VLADTLLDLHAKLSTVVRYYDRMLEDRLSNTYSQHTINSYATPQPAPTPVPNLYPNLPSRQGDGSGGAENFYAGNAMPLTSSPAAQPSNPYGREFRPTIERQSSLPPAVPSSHRYPYGAEAEQPHQSANSFAQPNPTNLQPYPQSPPARHDAVPQDSYWQSNSSAPSVQPSQMPPMPDADASYYLNNSVPSVQPPAPMSPPISTRPPPAPSPRQYDPSPAPMHMPRQYPAQGVQNALPPLLLGTPGAQPLPPGSPSYPHPAQSNALSYPTFSGYTQDSFPAAPHHQPQPKVVEESLIDL
jgi:growth factor-regulated tyrosine kinase substrate